MNPHKHEQNGYHVLEHATGPCSGFHGPHHGDLIGDLYHDCDIHHDHEGVDSDCPYNLKP